MKLLVAVAVGLTLLLTTGCTQDLFFSPEALLKREDFIAQCPTNTISGNVEIIGSKQIPEAAVIFYRTICYDQDSNKANQNYELIGSSRYFREGLGWQPSGGNEVASKPEVALAAKKEYFTSGVAGRNIGTESTTVTYGYIFSQEVKLVEAVLDNGKVLRDKGENGVFLILIPPDNSLRELRALDQNNTILRRQRYS